MTAHPHSLGCAKPGKVVVSIDLKHQYHRVLKVLSLYKSLSCRSSGKLINLIQSSKETEKKKSGQLLVRMATKGQLPLQ